MGQPAARLTDLAGHGGTIILGAPTVLIGGMPAARVGDPLVCPAFDGPKPHVMGNIVMGSFSVIIAGGFAARMGDMTGCGVAGVSAVGKPSVAGPPAPPSIPGAITPEQGSLYAESEHGGILYGQHTGYENEYGQSDQVRGSVEHLEGQTQIGGYTIAGSFDGLTGTGEYHSGYGSLGSSAGASVISGQASISDEKGNRLAGSGGLFNASAGVDTLLGTDGRRTGIAAGISAQASVAEGQIDETNVYRIPFTDYTVNTTTTLGGAALGVGGQAAGGAYHDAADDRFHVMGLVDLEVVIGAKLGLDVSFGRMAPPPPPPADAPAVTGVGIPLTPGTVITGLPTVLIG